MLLVSQNQMWSKFIDDVIAEDDIYRVVNIMEESTTTTTTVIFPLMNVPATCCRTEYCEDLIKEFRHSGGPPIKIRHSELRYHVVKKSYI